MYLSNKTARNLIPETTLRHDDTPVTASRLKESVSCDSLNCDFFFSQSLISCLYPMPDHPPLLMWDKQRNLHNFGKHCFLNICEQLWWDNLKMPSTGDQFQKHSVLWELFVREWKDSHRFTCSFLLRPAWFRDWPNGGDGEWRNDRHRCRRT